MKVGEYWKCDEHGVYRILSIDHEKDLIEVKVIKSNSDTFEINEESVWTLSMCREDDTLLPWYNSDLFKTLNGEKNEYK